MTKKFMSIVLCLMLSAMPLMVCALDTISISPMDMDKRIIVEGTSENSKSAVLVFYHKDNEPSGDTVKPSWVDAQGLDNGSFHFIVELDSDAAPGKYIARVLLDKYANNAVLSDAVLYYDTDAADYIVKNVLINSRTGKFIEKSAFIAAVKSDAASLGINTEDSLWQQSSDTLLEILHSADSKSISEFSADFAKASAFTRVKNGELDSSFKNYGDIMGVNSDAYSDYMADSSAWASGSVKSDLNSLLKKESYGKFMNNNSFGEYFKKLCSLAEVRGAKLNSGEAIRVVIEERYPALFSSLTGGNSSTYSAMMNESYNSFSDIAAAYNKHKPQGGSGSGLGGSGSSGSSGGSGGSGGMGGSGEISYPADTEAKPELGLGSTNDNLLVLTPNESASFYDVKEADWYFDAVMTLAKKGYIKGYGDGSYMPEAEVTRAEFTKMVYTSVGSYLTNTDGENVSFDDVSGEWFAPYVKEAARLGLIKGSGNSFMPNDKILRQDAALIVYRALAKAGYEMAGVPAYIDNIDISAYAFSAIGAMSKFKLLQGSDGYFYPKASITRAQAATLIKNTLDYLGGLK